MGTFLTKHRKPTINFSEAERTIKERLEQTGSDCRSLIASYENCAKSNRDCQVMGCLFGSIIGDALGAYCEFQTAELSQELIDQTMEMEGGGVFNLHPGQFTDDSEMAFHLLRGLSSFAPTQPLKDQSGEILVKIASEYVQWEDSAPFDIGITCRKGIEVIKANLRKDATNVDVLLQKVAAVNGNSQSNGSLMRIAPMAIFLAVLNEDPSNHAQFIKNEIALIHSNQVLQEAGFIWVKVLYDLIRRNNDNIATFQKILDTAQGLAANLQIKKWFESAANNSIIPAVENMGWAKIAWTYGISLLVRLAKQQNLQLNYEEEIRKVISRGGDSDTNAAIVGGLLGAVVGFKKLPGSYLKTVFELRFPADRIQPRDRPQYYEPANVLGVLLGLMNAGKTYQSRGVREVKAGDFPACKI